MDSILKLVMFSREHPDLELYKKFAESVTIEAGNKYEKAIEESKIIPVYIKSCPSICLSNLM